MFRILYNLSILILLKIIYDEAAFALVTQYKVRKIIKVRNMSKNEKITSTRGKWLESYESIALKLAEDDCAFLCNIHRPYKLDIIMIKPSKFTMYWA